MSVYPGAIDTSFPGYPYLDDVEYVLAEHANSWVLAIQAIETTIGAGTGAVPSNPLFSPQLNQSFPTVAARLYAAEQNIASSVVIDSSDADIQPVGAASEEGDTGMAADASHVHLGVTSINGRSGVVTLGLSDVGGFTAPGQLIVGTGPGTGELLNPGAPGTVLSVGGSDPSGVQWSAGQWSPGDFRFTGAQTWDPTAWFPCDSSALARIGTYNALYLAITLSFTATANGSFTIIGIPPSVTPNLASFYAIEGPAVPANTIIQTVGATTATLNNPVPGGTGTFRVFPYGNGNGSSTFNVPDGRGRMPVGAFGPGTNAQPTIPVGYFGGEQFHALQPVEGPAHSHNTDELIVVTTGAPNAGAWAIAPNGSQYGPQQLSVFAEGPAAGSPIGVVGSGQGHNNMPPFIAGRWLIHI